MADNKSQKPEIGEDHSSPDIVRAKGLSKTTIIALGIAGALAAIVLIAGMALAATHLFGTNNNGRFTNRLNGAGGYSMMDGTNMPARRQRSSSMGNGGITWSGTHIQGTVVSVSGDSFVVAGNGKRVTVNKTSTTTYRTSNTTVAVDDTVLVEGTTGSDGTMTATMIAVYNSAQ